MLNFGGIWKIMEHQRIINIDFLKKKRKWQVTKTVDYKYFTLIADFQYVTNVAIYISQRKEKQQKQ